MVCKKQLPSAVTPPLPEHVPQVVLSSSYDWGELTERLDSLIHGSVYWYSNLSRDPIELKVTGTIAKAGRGVMGWVNRAAFKAHKYDPNVKDRFRCWIEINEDYLYSKKW